jgi:hypothetical protein
MTLTRSMAAPAPSRGLKQAESAHQSVRRGRPSQASRRAASSAPMSRRASSRPLAAFVLISSPYPA